METAVLLIDSDLGFLFWLGRALDHAGYEAYPARNVADAITLVSQLQLKVGVLILNCLLPGASEFIATQRLARPNLKVIAIAGTGADQTFCPAEVDAVCCKPAEINEFTKNELVQLVQRVLSLNSFAY